MLSKLILCEPIAMDYFEAIYDLLKFGDLISGAAKPCLDFSIRHVPFA